MRLEFFPSRSLTLYLARLFVVRIFAVLLMLVLVLQTLDLLGESGKILAQPGNGEAQLWHYVTLRFPQLVAKFLPNSVLLATIITLSTLNHNSEVISMKAAGMSAHQVLAPLLLAAFGVSLVSFTFNELVVTRATTSLKAWSAEEYGPVPKYAEGRKNIYLADGANIFAAQSISGRGKDTVLHGVTWYERDQRGMVISQLRSDTASFANPGWRMAAPKQFIVADIRSASVAPIVVAPGIDPANVLIATIDPDGQNVIRLAQSIKDLQAAGRRTTELEGRWLHKFSGPLSAVLMPLLGAIAAFGLARSGQLLVRSIIGMALGFAYFVLDNAALAMGNFGGYPPLVAAWAPFILFALIGETVLVRTEE